MGKLTDGLIATTVLALALSIAAKVYVAPGAKGTIACHFFDQCPEIRILGHSLKPYTRVREAFENNFKLAREDNAQVAVWVDGKEVVNLAGTHGLDSTYDTRSLQNVFSTSKVLTSMVMSSLRGRGLFEYEDAVSKYWPEFAQHGKENIRIIDVLRHEGGLSHLPFEIDAQVVGDLDKMAELLAGTVPRFPPKETGTNRVYHALTRGWILNEIARRTDGRTVGQILKEDFVDSLRDPNYEAYIGNVPLDAEIRVFPLAKDPEIYTMLTVIAPGILKHALPSIVPDNLLTREQEAASRIIPLISRDDEFGLANPGLKEMRGQDPSWFNSRESHTREIPSANAVTNARSLAALGAHYQSGSKGIMSQSLVSDDTLANAYSEKKEAEDHLVMVDSTFCAGGFANHVVSRLGTTLAKSEGEGSYGWQGWGGSTLLWNNVKGHDGDVHEWVFAYVPTRMGLLPMDDPRIIDLMDALQESLENL